MTIDHLVEQGNQLMWRQQPQEAVVVLEKALEMLRRSAPCALNEDSDDEQSPRSNRSSPHVAFVSPCASPTLGLNAPSAAQRQCDAGPTLQALLTVYSRAREWQKIYKCAQRALQSDSCFSIRDRSAKLDITLRRAVALTHLAGPDEDNPHRLPDAAMLAQAEKDLLEVENARPKDDVVRRGLRYVKFLMSQTSAAIPGPLDCDADVGLARLRAMEA